MTAVVIERMVKISCVFQFALFSSKENVTIVFVPVPMFVPVPVPVPVPVLRASCLVLSA